MKAVESRIKVDTYGFLVPVGARRHKDCTCPVLCTQTFRCESSHHRGSREMPWCQGGDDYADVERDENGDGKMIERCNRCWNIWWRHHELKKTRRDRAMGRVKKYVQGVVIRFVDPR